MVTRTSISLFLSLGLLCTSVSGLAKNNQSRQTAKVKQAKVQVAKRVLVTTPNDFSKVGSLAGESARII